MKPVINLDELEFQSHEDGPFKESYGIIGEKIGAQKLGYSLTILPPGKMVCPFHNHHTSEEMFFILEGTGTLRFGEKTYPLRAHDVIACPPGGREVAHQIINTGETDLKYFCLSTKEPAEVVEYPDSNKILVSTSEAGNPKLRLIFKADQTVDYFEGEM